MRAQDTFDLIELSVYVEDPIEIYPRPAGLFLRERERERETDSLPFEVYTIPKHPNRGLNDPQRIKRRNAALERALGKGRVERRERRLRPNDSVDS